MTMMMSEKLLKGFLKRLKSGTFANKALSPIRELIRDQIQIRSMDNLNLSKEQLNVIKKAISFGYLSWPKKISNYTVNKDILDVGCGTGLHSIGYIVNGSKSYTGLDPNVDLNNDRGKNLRKRKFEKFGWNPSDLMNIFPNVKYIGGIFEDIAPNQKFDIAVLHNVTEHLHNLDQVFAGITERLRDNGKMLFNHHNYYCWNGHHQMPKTINDINLKDKSQLQYIDWAHLEYADRYDDKLSKKLNKITIDQLFKITDRYFDVEVWDEIPSSRNKGADRFTESILKKYDKYTKRDLTVQHVFCVAKLKSQILKKYI